MGMIVKPKLRETQKMNKYRVWGYETVPYYLDIEAKNKNDAYEKSLDADHMDWIEGETYGLWNTSDGFKIKKNMIEAVKNDK